MLWGAGFSSAEYGCVKGMCLINQTCEEAAAKLDPLQVVIEDRVFELDPMGFLMSGSLVDAKLARTCIIAVMPNPEVMDGSPYTMFLLGDAFLRNFYSVYDYEHQAVQLAVNTHSKDIARIYKLPSPYVGYFVTMALVFLTCAGAYKHMVEKEYKDLRELYAS